MFTAKEMQGNCFSSTSPAHPMPNDFYPPNRTQPSRGCTQPFTNLSGALTTVEESFSPVSAVQQLYCPEFAPGQVLVQTANKPLCSRADRCGTCLLLAILMEKLEIRTKGRKEDRAAASSDQPDQPDVSLDFHSFSLV